MNGKWSGDPAKLAAAVVQLFDSDSLLLRFIASADGMEGVGVVDEASKGRVSIADAHSASDAVRGVYNVVRHDPTPLFRHHHYAVR